MSQTIRKKIDSLPNIGQEIAYDEMPIIEAADYLKRIHAALAMADGRFTHLLVYADREHFSNIEYFTGYDSRFEEALLILSNTHKPVIIVGDEGCSYARKISFDIEIVTYPPFSLPNQPQDKDITLESIFKDVGISYTSQLGIIGWKVFDLSSFQNIPQYDLPYFIMRSILNVTDMDNVHNAIELMIGNEKGLRHYLEPKELVLCEISGTKTSRAVYRVIKHLQVGISELEASSFLQIDGDPLCVHPNINFGQNLFYALASPTSYTRLRQGDIVGVGMAYRRSLCHKVSAYVPDSSALSKQTETIYDRYFQAICAWYETLRIGVTGGEMYTRVCDVIGNPVDFGIALNLGHLIHTEEWTNSPIYHHSKVVIHSGMALQCDFTASFSELNMAVHAEDGVVLADETTRKEMERLAPKSYARIMNRRDFMSKTLGINIAPEVLPTSDLPAVIFPYLLDLNTVLAIA